MVARRQLHALDIGPATVHRWLATGIVHRIHPGVFAVGHTALADQGWLAAALLYAGPDARLSHATAAWWLGLEARRPSVIEVSSPRRRHSRPGAVTVYGRRALPAAWYRELPTTPIAQVLLDRAATADEDTLRRAIAEVEFRCWLDLDTLRGQLGSGRRGGRRLRRALAAHEPRLALTRSAFERRLLEVCRRHGLPLPECNVTVEGHLVDALWRRERVVVELDGRDGHRSWAQTVRDRERDLRLRRAGHMVLRYVWDQFTRAGGREVADDLGYVLAARDQRARR